MSDKPKTIEALAKELGISETSLERMRRQYQMKHAENADAKLLRSLALTWEEKRDKVRLMGKQTGYVENYMGALHIRGVEGEQEPESIPEHVQVEFSRQAWETFAVVKGEELAKRETRSRAERLRQAEFALRQKGKPHKHYAQVIEDAIEAMNREAKAA